MSTFQFSMNLGAGISTVEATACFYGVSDQTPRELGVTSVDSTDFTVDLDADGYTYLYVLLRVDDYNGTSSPTGNILLLSVFLNDDTNVSIGERETIANIFCFSRFTYLASGGTVSIVASDRDMGIMYGMRNNFIAVDGSLSDVISGSPNGMETNSYSMFNFLANLLYYCIVDPTVYNGFMSLSSSSGSVSDNTIEAFHYMTLNPWNQAQAIYDLISGLDPIYTPWLPGMYTEQQLERWSPLPNQWTLTIKVHDSGARNFLISGPGYIAFDENDRLWITNNVTQGSPNSSMFCVVLNPDGSPADFSPVFGGGLQGGGFGVAAQGTGERMILGNYGWGPKQYNPQSGSISVIASDGSLVSPSEGYTPGLSRVQGIMYDSGGNLWITSWGSQEPMAPSNETIYDFPDVDSAIVVYLNFDGSRAPEPGEVLTYAFDTTSPFNGTFDVAFDGAGNAFVANAGGKSPDKQITCSSVYKLRINLDDPNNPYIEKLASWTSDTYEALRQISVDSDGNVYVASVGGGCIVKFDNDLGNETRITESIGKPWGVSFGTDGTMYVANFFALHEAPPAEGEGDVRGTFCMTIFPKNSDTPLGIMNLPTGGSPVMLANGYGIYGGTPPCYQPLSRITGSVIDRVGNLWAVNNWKPSAYLDFTENPGGDGLVAFVGVAAPNQ